MSAEFTAFKARLNAHTILSGNVDDTVRVDDDGPVRANYVVATGALPDRLTDDRYLARQQYASNRRYTFDVRVVATSANGRDMWADAVMSQLIGHELGVEGRRCDAIEFVEGVEEGFWHDKTARLFGADMSFRFWSRRA